MSYLCIFCSFFPEKLDRNSHYDGVQSFVLFVGYPRSSHSLVGAILDSHPEIIIPHEFDLLNKFNRFFNDPNEDSNSQDSGFFPDCILSHGDKPCLEIAPQTIHMDILTTFQAVGKENTEIN